MAHDESLEEFYTDFMQQFLHGDGSVFREEAFLEDMAEQIRDIEGFEDCQPAHFRDPNRGLRIDGHGGEPVGIGESDKFICLFSVDFHAAESIETLTKGDLDKVIKRGTKFIEQCRNDRWCEAQEQDHEWYETVELIRNHWDETDKFRLIVLSNRALSDRVHEVEFSEVDGKTVETSVWDIRRFYRMAVEGRGKEPVVVDFENEFGGGLPVITADLDESSLESYLFVMPAEKLAKIYDRWGTRLLEQNVRVFLQGRGKVNKGMRLTMEHNPELFFSYNNGITVTASSVDIVNSGNRKVLNSIEDMQIVNGGQTTASIHAFLKNKESENLSKVFVQVKLSVMGEEMDRDRKAELVSKISQYSNLQNKVNNADFFANHPYHVRIEKFSRDMWTPQAAGAVRVTKWFYERARGQYADEKSRRTPAERNKFQSVHPTSQKFTKTDLAKFMMLFGVPDDPRPDLVSLGAEKCFMLFGKKLEPLWDKSEHTFNERHFRNLIARAIVFKACDKLVWKAEWYGGYKANIVAYSIAKLNHEIGLRKRHLDLESIWTMQAMTPALSRTLEDIARQFGDPGDGFLATTADSRNMTNRSEWAKKEDCWKLWRDYELEEGTISDGLLKELLTDEQEEGRRRNSGRDEKTKSEVADLTKIHVAGPWFWQTLFDFGTHEKLFRTPKEKSQIQAVINGKIPSEAQVKAIMKIYRRFREEGFPNDIDDHQNDDDQEPELAKLA